MKFTRRRLLRYVRRIAPALGLLGLGVVSVLHFSESRAEFSAASYSSRPQFQIVTTNNAEDATMKVVNLSSAPALGVSLWCISFSEEQRRRLSAGQWTPEVTQETLSALQRFTSYYTLSTDSWMTIPLSHCFIGPTAEPARYVIAYMCYRTEANEYRYHPWFFKIWKKADREEITRVAPYDPSSFGGDVSLTDRQRLTEIDDPASPYGRGMASSNCHGMSLDPNRAS